jgi:hypothetical protein
MKVLITVAVTLVALVLGGILYVYSGFYEMGAPRCLQARVLS